MGPAYKHPSELSSRQFARNGGRQELLAVHHSKSFITLMTDSRQPESKHGLLGITFRKAPDRRNTRTHRHRHQMTACAYAVHSYPAVCIHAALEQLKVQPPPVTKRRDEDPTSRRVAPTVAARGHARRHGSVGERTGGGGKKHGQTGRLAKEVETMKTLDSHNNRQGQ